MKDSIIYVFRGWMVAGLALVCVGLSQLQGAAWQWNSPEASVRIDTDRTGQILAWEVGGKTLVDDTQAASPLALELATGQMVNFVAESDVAQGTDGVDVQGYLKGADVDIPVTLSYGVLENGRRLKLAITVKTRADTGVYALRWSLPLSLNHRKRTFYLTDYGKSWETRYFYQSMLSPSSWRLLNEPDRNIWRYFSLDQLGPNAFRLWKSESAETAPLVMHQGVFAAPVEQLYDEEGGVALEYPGLLERFPSALLIDASGGGEMAAALLARGVSPVPAASLDGTYTLTLTGYASEDAILAAQPEYQQKYASDFTSELPDPDHVLDEPGWLVDTPMDESGLIYVTGGYPFVRDSLHSVEDIRVQVSGQAVPVQAEPLAYWPDGSYKWVLLTFPVEAAAAVEDCAPPKVTLRNGRCLPVNITVAGGETPPVVEALHVEATAEAVTIRGKDMIIGLKTGEGWLDTLTVRGKSLLDGQQAAVRAYSDYLYRPEGVFPFRRGPVDGTLDAGVLQVDQIAVEEAGPLRAVVRLEGLTSNQEPTRMIIRVEVDAGAEQVRITHTAVFRFRDPRQTFLKRMGIEFPLKRELFDSITAGRQEVDGLDYDSVALLQQTYQHQQLDLQPFGGGFVEHEYPEDSDEWMVLEGEAGAITAVMRNMRQMAPAAIRADSDQGVLQFEFWPSSAEPMDVRRYSEHLQLGQLESGWPLPASTWVDDFYYGNEPVYGISRTHEILLSWADKMVEPARAAQVLSADYQSPPLLYAGWDRYAASGVVLPSSQPQDWPRAWDSWTRVVRFFLFHRALYQWYGFWNYGDFRHRVGGFGMIVTPEVLENTPEGSLREFRIWDNVAMNEWAYDNGAYGWTNTEGLPGLFLISEYMRHGNRQVYFAAEAMSRYERDVIVRQEGQWLGKGTRHGVQPWSDGNHEERQTAATEYRLQYLLSGDARTRDVINLLYDQVYTKTTAERHADHSGRLPGLMFHWELTGDPAEAKRLEDYVHCFVSDKGIYVSPVVEFPAVELKGEPKQLNSGSKFFHTFGGMHGLLEYYYLTHDEAVKRAMFAMADEVIQRKIIENGWLGEGDCSWVPVAFAARYADNPQPYRDFLRRYIAESGWDTTYQVVTENPEHWTGPTTIMAKIVPLSFFWLNWAPYVTDAAGEEVWTPKIEKQYQDRERHGRGDVKKRESWQSVYDGIPGADAYLGPSRPWQTESAGDVD